MDLLERLSEYNLRHVLRAVFSALSHRDVSNCRRVSRRWRRILQEFVLSDWTDGDRCRHGWLTAPLALAQVDLTPALGAEGCSKRRSAATKVFGSGHLRIEREVPAETTTLSAVDGRAFCAVRQFVGFPMWEAEVAVFDGGGLVAKLAPAVPEEVAKESRFEIKFSDLVVLERVVVLSGMQVMPRGHPIVSKDLLWVFRKDGGACLGLHVLGEGLNNRVMLHFAPAKDHLRVFVMRSDASIRVSRLDPGDGALLQERTVTAHPDQPGAACRLSGASLAHIALVSPSTPSSKLLEVIRLQSGESVRSVKIDLTPGARDDTRVLAATINASDKLLTLTESWEDGLRLLVTDLFSLEEERVVVIEAASLLAAKAPDATFFLRFSYLHFIVQTLGDKFLTSLKDCSHSWQLLCNISSGRYAILRERHMRFPSYVCPLADDLLLLCYLETMDGEDTKGPLVMNLKDLGSPTGAQDDGGGWLRYETRVLQSEDMKSTWNLPMPWSHNPHLKGYHPLRCQDPSKHIVSFEGSWSDYLLVQQEDAESTCFYKLSFESECI